MSSRITHTFMELVQIDSESYAEGPFLEYLKERFDGLGLEIDEDDSTAETGLGSNNLIARLAGDASIAPLFLSAHIDTVSPGKGIVPVIRDDVVYSEGETILAADDKAGIAIMIEVVERLREGRTRHGPIELVLTPGEEVGLLGAKALDMSTLKAKHGLILDNGGPVGGIILSSPSMFSLNIDIHGKAAHAGLEPEKGISALVIAAEAIHQMKLGRITEQTTANIGKISGGTGSNVVMEHATLVGEARSLDHDACVEQVTHMVETFERAAQNHGGTVDIKQQQMIRSYRFEEDEPFVRHVSAALAHTSFPVRYEHSGGGSDANVFNEFGKVALNVSIGYDSIHTVDESIPIKELEDSVTFVLRLIETMQSFKA
ncbi:MULTISPECIES: M20/M25/M40 family metallo-hydrolase [unclassified Exiguobacterium]|uniref:M20/M25/M40 family metallo-hydrolase n=1 Tax=unclassified Exiguobacterium TaxID=2644629 RepID=UPI00103E6095|nr:MULTISPECIES: M20/M25/M40 family metallo-hydrolase [unclassified Exiguobacterium]TCI48201.1 M20/M25/M40 family metallo-hydrolase [Exiguobacterium sp. SH5S32]TCI55088.1 M20/M25/M40 family metallo-hydrolase [Exiguobacterium sp. SH1S4]TCI74880.1 M20/M25/M40 family metallo-hydrolase [Exiguobacterium sp. SH1S1]